MFIASTSNERDCFNRSLDHVRFRDFVVEIARRELAGDFISQHRPLKLGIIENGVRVIVGTAISRRRMVSYSSFTEDRNHHR